MDAGYTKLKRNLFLNESYRLVWGSTLPTCLRSLYQTGACGGGKMLCRGKWVFCVWVYFTQLLRQTMVTFELEQAACLQILQTEFEQPGAGGIQGGRKQFLHWTWMCKYAHIIFLWIRSASRYKRRSRSVWLLQEPCSLRGKAQRLTQISCNAAMRSQCSSYDPLNLELLMKKK